MLIYSRTLLALATCISALLAACGGGGASGGASSSTGTSSNTISVAQLAVSAGQTLPVAAKATFRAATPSAMSWAISYNGNAAGTGGTGIPSFADATCAASSLQAPAFTNSMGVGSCTTVLTIPPDTPTGVWRITNTATSTTGSVTDAVDITVTPQPSGFSMLSSSAPIAATAGQTVTLSLPYTASTGAVVSNVQYSWTEAAGNPAKSTIVGSGNPMASVIVPTSVGAYTYNATVTAMVNGASVSGNGSVVVNVAATSTASETLFAGDVQVVTITDAGTVVKLTGLLSNLDTTANAKYTYAWTQVNQTAGLPIITLANANSSTASLSAPTVPGTYAFRLTVTKIVNGATVATLSADTSVVVQATQTPVFSATAGNAQTVNLGNVVTLTGTVTPQSITSATTNYTYQWTQTGTPPATVALSNATTRTATFIPSVAGTYQFTLAVTATSGTSSNTVYANTQVVVSDAAKGFTVTAGNAQTVIVNTATAMAGAVTTTGDYTGAVFTYAWTQTAGPAVTVANATAATASVVPTVAGTYTFQLIVTCLQNGVTTTGTAITQVLVTP